MNDSYLNTFDNLFYNVNNNSNVKNTSIAWKDL